MDGCGGKSVFPRMWDIAHHLLAGSIVSTLEEVRQAMKIVAERNHVIAEGAGACAVAAGLSGKCGSGKIVCVVSGGNIDLSVFTQTGDMSRTIVGNKRSQRRGALAPQARTVCAPRLRRRG